MDKQEIEIAAGYYHQANIGEQKNYISRQGKYLNDNQMIELKKGLLLALWDLTIQRAVKTFK